MLLIFIMVFSACVEVIVVGGACGLVEPTYLVAIILLTQDFPWLASLLACQYIIFILSPGRANCYMLMWPTSFFRFFISFVICDQCKCEH